MNPREAVDYYKSLGGKSMRNTIADIIGQLLGTSPANIEFAKSVIDDIHNASLVVDDVEDASSIRRGRPTAHVKFGMPLALNSAYYTVFHRVHEVAQYMKPETTAVVLKDLVYVHEGQGMDLYFSHHRHIPDMATFETMLIYKTGYVLILLMDLLMDSNTNVLIAKNYKRMKEVLTLFALFYQIRDDYVNLTDPDYWREKGFCHAIDEQKISYLVVLYGPVDMTDRSIEGKKRVVRLFHKAGVLDRVYEKLTSLRATVLAHARFEPLFGMLPVKRFDLAALDTVQ